MTSTTHTDAAEIGGAVIHYILGTPERLKAYIKDTGITSTDEKDAAEILAEAHDRLAPGCKEGPMSKAGKAGKIGSGEALGRTLADLMNSLGLNALSARPGQGRPPGVSDPITGALWANWQACVLQGDTKRAAEYREMYAELLNRLDRINSDPDLDPEQKDKLLNA